MSEDRSARLGMPLLYAGQAQKEIMHNEALALLDAATGAAIVAAGLDAPPEVPTEGDSWIVGDAPAGAWIGHAGELATWTAGGWRFLAPPVGFNVWDRALGCFHLRTDAGWERGIVRGKRLLINDIAVVNEQQPSVADPSGGTTIDVEARATIAAMLSALRAHGLIAT